MNAADPSAAFTTVFDGKRTKATGVIKKNGEVVTNPVMNCFITGYGKSEKLYTMDHNIASSQIVTNINQYNIGEGLPWDKAPSAVIYDDNQNSGRMQNGSGQIYPDARGGWWMSQYRYTSTVAVPSLIHITNAKTDFNSGTAIGTSQNGGMAVSPDGNLIAIGRELGTIAVYTVSYNSKNVPTLTEWCTIPYGEDMESSITMGCEFDAAGNLYVVSHSNHRLMVFTMPKLDNSFTTRREPIPADPIDEAVPAVNSDSKKKNVRKHIRNGLVLIDSNNETYTAGGKRM
jgi:sugar lactone lactonase YvrE